MPKIRNCYGEEFYLECNLFKNKSFIYDDKNEDYLNWIPIKVKLCMDKEIHNIGYYPTLSIEGLNYLFAIKDKLIEEKKLKIKFSDNDDREYSTFSYYATEEDFELCFHNLYDDREVAVVKITSWYARGGYREGYDFVTTLDDCISFIDEL